MTAWLQIDRSNLWSLAALITASILIFVTSRGTSFQQFGIGLLTASVSLVVVMAVFEAIWHIVATRLNLLNDGKTSANTPKSRHHRR